MKSDEMLEMKVISPLKKEKSDSFEAEKQIMIPNMMENDYIDDNLNQNSEFRNYGDEQNEEKVLEKSIYLARFCLEIGKYEDGVNFVDNIVKLKESELTEEERNLFAIIYREFLNQIRSSWRNIYNQEEKEKFDKSKFLSMMSEIRNNIEEKIKKNCEKVINLINNNALKRTDSSEGKAFFHKMKGDFFRYLSEVSYGDALVTARKNASQNYEEAVSHSNGLETLNVVRLGNLLNYAIFQYEVMNKTTKAISIAKTTLNEAANELKLIGIDAVLNEDLKDSLEIIHAFKDNLSHWQYEEVSENMKH